MAHALSSAGNALQKCSTHTATAIFTIGMLVMAFMPLPVFIDVMLRETVSGSLPGTNDLVELAFLVTCFATFAWLGAHNDHIVITFMVEKLRPARQLLFQAAANGITLAFIATLAVNIGLKAHERWLRSEHTLDLEWPTWIFAAFATVGAAVMCLGAFSHFLASLGESLKKNSLLANVLVVALVLAFLLCPWWYRALGAPLTPEGLGGIGMLCMVAFLFAGVPIGVAMGAVGLVGLLCLYPNVTSAFSQAGLAPLSTTSNYTYTVIPMFILMGELAFYSHISRDIFTAANTWMGRLPGGLAMAGVAGCAGFAAVCGDSMATAVTMGSVALPEMEKKNYEKGLSCASLAAGGTLGILIPPSMGFIFYAIITEESVGRLFMAGIIPGLLLTFVFLSIIGVIALRHPHLAPRGEKHTLGAKLLSLKGLLPMLALIVFILGGILYGFFSPNEGGAMGAVGTFLYAVSRRRLSIHSLLESLRSTLLVSGRLMVILVGVGILGYFFALTQLPQHLATFVSSIDANRYVILVGIMVVYIILGCLMNVIPMIMLTLPAIFPTVQALQFDPVWFGVITVLLMEMGQITPPVGINVFAISSIARDVPMQTIFKRITPFFLGMVAVLALLTIFPDLALWLPRTFFR